MTNNSLVSSILSLRVFLLLFILVIFLTGLYKYALIKVQNNCHMTYMFQNPQFIKLEFEEHIVNKYPNYNLYVYGEGPYAQNIRDGKLDGVAVIFVPGNGGSYKQVRSFGSIALRMADKYSTGFYLNYFAVDFNEELSGVNSDVLSTQTSFLVEVMESVLSIYDTNRSNASIILIGHSIGGVIIRSVFTLPSFARFVSHIHVIITLATPHHSPVIPMDWRMRLFYSTANNYWQTNRHTVLSHINVISIGGGFNDKLVRSDLTVLTNNTYNDLSVVTTSIQDVWLSTDHLCIVWCKQLIIKLNRALFDLVDTSDSLTINRDIDKRNEIIDYHLLDRKMAKRYSKQFVFKYSILSINGDWTLNKERIIRINKIKVIKSTYILLPLTRKETIVIKFSGVTNFNWIMACNATSNKNLTHCDKGLNLYSYAKLMPPFQEGVECRVFKSSSNTLIEMGFTNLLIALTPTKTPISVSSDRFLTANRIKRIALPSLISRLKSLFSSITILDIPISEQSSFYSLRFLNLEEVWDSYWLNLEVLSCYTTARDIGYIHFTIPWNKEDQYKTFFTKSDQNVEMALKINMRKPNNFNKHEFPRLYLYVNSECGYRLHLKPYFSEMISQILRYYGVSVLPMVVSILLSTLTAQLNIAQFDQFDRNSNGIKVNNGFHSGHTKSFYSHSAIVMKNFKLISMSGVLILSPVLLALYSNLEISLLQIYRYNTFIQQIIASSNLIFLYIFIYLIAYSITYFFLLIITFAFISISSAAMFLESKVLAQFQSKRNKLVVESNSKKLWQLKTYPLICSLVIIVFGFLFVSSLTFLFCLILHHIQLVNLCKKCIGISNRRGLDVESSLWHLHLTILALLYISMIPTIPSLLSWLNLNMPLFYLGSNDSYLMSAILLSISCSIIWQRFYITNFNNEYLMKTLKAITILSSIWCQITYSTISQLIPIYLMILSIYQLKVWYFARNIKCD